MHTGGARGASRAKLAQNIQDSAYTKYSGFRLPPSAVGLPHTTYPSTKLVFGQSKPTKVSVFTEFPEAGQLELASVRSWSETLRCNRHPYMLHSCQNYSSNSSQYPTRGIVFLYWTWMAWMGYKYRLAKLSRASSAYSVCPPYFLIFLVIL